MTDKTRCEHNRSAFGCIATEAPLAEHVEPGCGAVIRALAERGRIMRYELTDDEWTAHQADTLPNKPRGVPRVHDRRVVNGIFRVLRSGAPWRDLPSAGLGEHPNEKKRTEALCFSPHLCRARNLVERFFNKIKHSRCVATRYDKLAANYLAFRPACAFIRSWLRVNEPAS